MLVCLLLTGCDTLVKRGDDGSTPVPANLTVRCDPIPALTVKANLGDLVKYTTDLMTLYNECAIRNDSLIETVTKPNKNGK